MNGKQHKADEKADFNPLFFIISFGFKFQFPIPKTAP
jgi:outer membrane protein W